MTLPLLLSVPHAGARVPEEVERSSRLTAREIAEDGDEGAAEIYDLSEEVERYVTTDVARAFVDVNRAEDDRRPDGVVKTHTCMNVPVYEPFPTEEAVESLLARYYRPYHRQLTELAATPGIELAIDCHTMLAIGPPIGPLAGKARPRLCLGDVDGATCPPELFVRLHRCLERAFRTEVGVNFPFKGGYITRRHGTERSWVQLEISRAPFLSNAEKRACTLAALREFAGFTG